MYQNYRCRNVKAYPIICFNGEQLLMKVNQNRRYCSVVSRKDYLVTTLLPNFLLKKCVKLRFFRFFVAFYMVTCYNHLITI